MVPEAQLTSTEHGVVPEGDGWFVLNARDAVWHHAPGRPAHCSFEGDPAFAQLGVNVTVLEPGVACAMYHWEADQEDFLVIAGEALLIVEGQERPLRPWDLVHCPPGTRHTIVGAGSGPCVLVAVGAREHENTPGWGAYTVEEAALRHDAGVARETADGREAYADVPARGPTRARPGWLPDA